MDFMRRWSGLGDESHNQEDNEDNDSDTELNENTRNERKRELNVVDSPVLSKRRKLSETRFSFGNLLTNPVKAIRRLFSNDVDEEAMEQPIRFGSTKKNNKNFTPRKPDIIDLDREDEGDDVEVSYENTTHRRSSSSSNVKSPLSKVTILQRSPIPLVTSVDDDDDDDEPQVVKTITNVALDKSIEIQESTDEEDDLEVVAEVLTPGWKDRAAALENTRMATERTRDLVIAASASSHSGHSSPDPSVGSSTSSVVGRVSSPSIAPEDSVSRQPTPNHSQPYIYNHVGRPRKDCWGRDNTKHSRKSKQDRIGKAIPKFAVGTNNEAGLDIYQRMLADRGGVLIDTTAISLHRTEVDRTVKTKTHHLKRLRREDHFERARRLLDGIEKENKRRGRSLQNNTSNQLANQNELLSSITPTSSNTVIAHGEEESDEVSDLPQQSVNENIPSTPNRCGTPMSTTSSGTDQLTDLISRINVGHMKSAHNERSYRQVLAINEAGKLREIEIKEEDRIRGARRSSREEIEEKTRKRLEILGVCYPKPKVVTVRNEFPELPAEARELLEKAWKRKGDPNELFSKLDELEITRKDLLTIAGLSWLNDEVINYYLRLVVNRGDETEGLPKVFAFNTFFYKKLSTKGYSLVKRWTKKVDIFAKDVILIPVHQEIAMHWCMAVIDMGKKIVTYYDSLPCAAKDRGCLSLIRQYLIDESKDKKKEVFNETGWTYVFREDTPKQNNGSDCGVFSCKFGEFASRRASIVFSHEHMQYYRQRMVYEIVNNKLL